MKIWFRSTKPAWSRGRYRLFLLAWWLYTLAWLAAILAVHFLLPIGTVLKVVATGVLIVLTPTGGGYFTSYEQYRRWHAEHVIVSAEDSKS